MTTPQLMAESDFHQRVDAILTALEGAFDDTDIESELNGGILTLECRGGNSGGSRIIINRQTPNREIWVAAKSGGFHFRYDGSNWVDTRSGESLSDLLARTIAQQSGNSVRIALP